MAPATDRTSEPARSKRAHATSSLLRAAAKLVALVLLSGLVMPFQLLVMVFTRGRSAYVLPRLWHRCVCAILGIRVEVLGTPQPGDATLYVGNHISHFDIPLLGSVLRARFIAKDDMRDWPGVTFVAGLQQTLFISRRARDAGSVATQVADAMRPGDALVLFAEGTTSDGTSVAAFKSSLFALVAGRQGEAVARGWTVQPFTIELRGIDGHPLRDAGDRDRYAFHGNVDAGAHVGAFLRGRGATLRLHLHAPIAIAPGATRKTLAAHAHAIVASALP